jgi:hypothetical protein
VTFKRLTLSQLERHIRQTARDTGLIYLTRHAVARMRERCVLKEEVFDCLRLGRLLTPGEEDMKSGDLVCRMHWYGPSSDLVVCVALDDARPGLLVVTVIA